MKNKHSTSIFLFTRDLRTTDSKALITCSKESNEIVPLFAFNPDSLNKKHKLYNPNYLSFQLEALLSLKENLPSLNIFVGDITKNISSIMETAGADALYMATDYTEEKQNFINDLKTACHKESRHFKDIDDILFTPLDAVKTKSNTHFLKIGPYIKTAMTKPVEAPSDFKVTNFSQKTLAIKGISALERIYSKVTKTSKAQPEGSISALNELISVHEKKNSYDSGVNLGPYLNLGLISPRELVSRLPENKIALEMAHWRDFETKQVALHPNLPTLEMKPNCRGIPFRNDKIEIDRWKKGETGFPYLDACMKVLVQEGRLDIDKESLVMSVFCKDMLCDWRIGLDFFKKTIFDYDSALNACLWQNAAATILSAPPYYRTYSSKAQSLKHDPDGKFIKKHIPTLESVPPKDIHDWESNYTKYKLHFKPMYSVSERKKEMMATYAALMYDSKKKPVKK